ncbi:caib/baif family protein-like protein [Diplocarpon rosae]|nr:caib/baif family protein-like protein [Diplocarpon rosae]
MPPSLSSRSLYRASRSLHKSNRQQTAFCDIRRRGFADVAGDDATLPLKGYKVLDMTRVLAGPYCTQILGDLGAQVIKIEHPTRGDDTRAWGPPYAKYIDGSGKHGPGESAYFIAVNRNKKSLGLSFQHKAGVEVLHKLAAESDILVENYLPGSLKKYEMDYETLSNINPRLIYASITGYGQTGPYSNRAGYDVMVEAEFGLMHITGSRDGPPVKVGVAVTDLTTGLYTSNSIMAAIISRERTGRGQHIDVALSDCQVATLANIASSCLISGEKDTGRWGTAHPSIVPYQSYKTKDGDILFGGGNDRLFGILSDGVGHPEWKTDIKFSANAQRVTNRVELDNSIEAITKTKTTQEWLEIFEGKGMPYSAVNDVQGTLNHQHVLARNMVKEMDHEACGPIKMVNTPVKYSESKPSIRSVPPMLGQHTDEVLRDLGLGEGEIEALKAEGATLNYRPGGFHPVHLNDVFKKGRYIVIHKLGHGGFATVWLGRDTLRQRYVALKILAARLSRDCPEVEILRRLKQSEDHEGKPFVMSLLDHFWIDGPNGKHLCVVSEVGGPSIKQFNECPGFTSGTRRLRGVVARKVLSSDFTAANILLQLANIDEWSVDEIHDRLGKPQTQILHRTAARAGEYTGPEYTVTAISMKLVDPRWLSDQIMIIDFGIAFMEDQSSVDIGTPKNYCAPEFNFKGPRSISSDIWALGCTIFEIRTGCCLFRYRGVPTRDQMLIATVKVLGKLPEIWWDQWEEGRIWYNVESQSGGQLVDIAAGTLHQEIMEIGLHDGDMGTNHPTHKDLGFKEDNLAEHESLKERHSSSEKHLNTTDCLIGLVEELNTSEAEGVMAALQKYGSGSSLERTDSRTYSSNKTKSGNASAGSSAGKSGDGGASEDVDMAVTNTEFLETSGAIISVVEALTLEDVLRMAMQFLPEHRPSAAQLAKHDWFYADFEGRF